MIYPIHQFNDYPIIIDLDSSRIWKQINQKKMVISNRIKRLIVVIHRCMTAFQGRNLVLLTHSFFGKQHSKNDSHLHVKHSMSKKSKQQWFWNKYPHINFTIHHDAAVLVFFHRQHPKKDIQRPRKGHRDTSMSNFLLCLLGLFPGGIWKIIWPNPSTLNVE
jgi:hypothetical protein